MKSKLRWLGSVVMSLLSSSCSLLVTPPLEVPHRVDLSHNQSASGEVRLFVFSHGHHTGITLPAHVFQGTVLGSKLPSDADWIELGWGDEGFYRSEEVTLSLAAKALLLPTRSVMHVSMSDETPLALYPYSPIRSFSLDEIQQEEIVNYISSSFATDVSGSLIELGPGRYGVSRFYRAEKSFFFPRTCNTWTSGALRSVGISARAVTAPGLMRQLPTPPAAGRNVAIY